MSKYVCPECGEPKNFRARTCRKCWVASNSGRGANTLLHRDAREKAAVALGRQLRKDEFVHHINMDPGDSRNCNLLVCSRRYHGWLHHQYEKALARTLVPPP